jgi:nifR3 family TIM-barrel protein
MPNFWNQFKKPIFALAPMEEVTDFAFREMFARHGKIGDSENRKSGFVMFTEFVNVDGLLHPEGQKKLLIDLKFSEIQRPMVAQIWGTNPEKFFQAAELIVKLGFDGIDINMGCPQDKEIGIGACAALIREPELAKEIIHSTMRGAGDLPVSVKTRLGYSKADEIQVWLRHLLETKPAVITLHARTKQEKSKVPAQWERIAEAVKLRNELKSETLIIGNGDVKSREEGLARVKETGCDGVMIARGAFGHPWLFRADDYQPSVEDRLKTMIEHAALFDETFNGQKSFFIMRKHFKAYASGFDGAHELRAKLMETKNLAETRLIVEEFLRK